MKKQKNTINWLGIFISIIIFSSGDLFFNDSSNNFTLLLFLKLIGMIYFYYSIKGEDSGSILKTKIFGISFKNLPVYLAFGILAIVALGTTLIFAPNIIMDWLKIK